MVWASSNCSHDQNLPVWKLQRWFKLNFWPWTNATCSKCPHQPTKTKRKLAWNWFLNNKTTTDFIALFIRLCWYPVPLKPNPDSGLFKLYGNHIKISHVLICRLNPKFTLLEGFSLGVNFSSRCLFPQSWCFFHEQWIIVWSRRSHGPGISFVICSLFIYTFIYFFAFHLGGVILCRKTHLYLSFWEKKPHPAGGWSRIAVIRKQKSVSCLGRTSMSSSVRALGSQA